MAWIELAEAREMLRLWIDAEKAVSSGLSYKIGSRSLTRVDLADITAQQNRWRKEIEKLESGATGAKVMRGVPVDL